ARAEARAASRRAARAPGRGDAASWLLTNERVAHVERARRIRDDARLTVRSPPALLVEPARAVVLLEHPPLQLGPVRHRCEGSVVQLACDVRAPPLRPYVEAVQPTALDAGNADGRAVTLRDQHLAGERLPAATDLFVGERIEVRRKDVRE